MRDGGRLKASPIEGSRDIKNVSGGQGTIIMQAFGKETRGEDMYGGEQDSQRRGMLNGSNRSLAHSITSDGNVTGVPTVRPPHKTRTAV